jgi:hypothetical protein
MAVVGELPLEPTFKPPNYDEKLDFNELARQDPEFAGALEATGGVVNFQNSEHVL